MFEYLTIAALLILLVRVCWELITTNKELYEYSDKSKRYYFAISEMDKWCRHDLPEVEVIAKHLIAEGEGLSRNAGTPVGTEACTVSGLREQLHRMKGK